MTETERQDWNSALSNLYSGVEPEQEKVRQERGRYGRSGDLSSWYVPDGLDSIRVTEYKTEEGVGWEIRARATDSKGVTYRRVYHCAGPMDNRGTEWVKVPDDTV